jgi:tetratricopeptide (TPR) repeat protein
MLIERRHDEATFAPRLAKALENVPAAQWDSQVLLGVARGLREAGRTDEARTLLTTHGGDPALVPSVNLERALSDLRDGPPARALPQLEQASRVSGEAAFRFADALFFAGLADSALAKFQEVAKEPASPFAGAALERIYLIEDAEPKSALPAFGRLAYEDWRGNGAAAGAIAESLFHALPRGPLWAQAALLLSVRRERTGDPRSALVPVLAVADSLPEDRLAPVARQRAGDLYLKLKDETHALAQYEECLARYPRAWNSAEVRRHVEQLRRDRRF